MEAGNVKTNDPPVSNDFDYKPEGRHDPFLPFLTIKSTTDDELVDEDGGDLAGLRRLEPRQLTLVALLNANGEHIAMAQDDTGIGYTLREGMRIGRRGMIEKITAAEVQIRETARTRAGKEVVQSIFMRFNKDGVK
ncbi:MAG: hypothetical protein BWK76_15680 [Desulfobulbaceae bacterium A2]|nr:MAG: hypothetical protein BWK76_15680 [Desulfobulbaceae bacterium A2]